MPYISVNDAEFDQVVTLRDAYRILERFVVQYNARGESNTVALMSDMGLLPNGNTSDPAQLEDFLACVHHTLAQELKE